VVSRRAQVRFLLSLILFLVIGFVFAAAAAAAANVVVCENWFREFAAYF